MALFVCPADTFHLINKIIVSFGKSESCLYSDDLPIFVELLFVLRLFIDAMDIAVRTILFQVRSYFCKIAFEILKTTNSLITSLII